MKISIAVAKLLKPTIQDAVNEAIFKGNSILQAPSITAGLKAH